MKDLELAALSDVGREHDHNEDSCAIVSCEDGGTLLAVCDGMGGMGRGDQASALAIDELTRRLSSGTGFPPDRLRQALVETDIVVREVLCDGPGNPGCTAVLAYVLNNLVHVAWVGDSRVYLIRRGAVKARTRDHKLVEALIEAGQLTREQAKISRLSSVITRALGGRDPDEPPVEPEVFDHPWQLEPGDVLMLCSDGLCDLVEDHEIAPSIAGRSSSDAAAVLVGMANDRGGHDNITVVMARVPGGPPEPVAAASPWAVTVPDDDEDELDDLSEAGITLIPDGLPPPESPAPPAPRAPAATVSPEPADDPSDPAEPPAAAPADAPGTAHETANPTSGRTVPIALVLVALAVVAVVVGAWILTQGPGPELPQAPAPEKASP